MKIKTNSFNFQDNELIPDYFAAYQRTCTSELRAFRKTFPNLPIKPGLVIAPAETCYPLAEHDFVLPWDTA